MLASLLLALFTSTPLVVGENWTAVTSSSICGYTEGIHASSAPCISSENQICQYFAPATGAPNFGCCPPGADICYMATCVDFGASENIITDTNLLWELVPGTLYCGAASPYCSTATFYNATAAVAGVQTYSSYGCRAVQNPPSFAVFPKAVVATTTQLLASASSSAAAPSTPSAILPTSTASSSQSQTFSTSLSNNISSQSPSQTSMSTTQKSKLSGGAEVGIGVGVGVGVTLVVGLLAFWLLRSRRGSRGSGEAYESTSQDSSTQDTHVQGSDPKASAFTGSIQELHGDAFAELTGQRPAYELAGPRPRYELASSISELPGGMSPRLREK